MLLMSNQNIVKIQISEFKLKMMKRHCSIIILAKRGSGKSFLTRDILYYLHFNEKIPAGLILAPTDRMNKFYKRFFPDVFIHHDISSSIFKNLLKRQMEQVQKRRQKIKEKKKIDPRCVLVMDDCFGQKHNWTKDEGILSVLVEGRHFKITYILTLQYSLGIGPDLRANFDYIFVLMNDNTNEKKKIHDYYAGIFETYYAFCKVLDACTDKYGCMVIDNRKPARGISEKVYRYKASEKKGFMFGSKAFRNFHDRNYGPKNIYKKYEKINNMESLIKKRNAPEIKVQCL
jgi:hypothetical protein